MELVDGDGGGDVCWGRREAGYVRGFSPRTKAKAARQARGRRRGPACSVALVIAEWMASSEPLSIIAEQNQQSL